MCSSDLNLMSARVRLNGSIEIPQIDQHRGGTEMRIQQTRIARDAVMVKPQRVAQPAAAECRIRLLQREFCVVLIRRKSAGVHSALAEQRPHEPFEQAHSGNST